MPTVVSITDFRNNIFDYTDKLLKYGDEFEVAKNGQSVFRVIPAPNDAVQRAKKALKILPKLAGIWADIPEKEFKEMRQYFRGPKGQLKNYDKSSR